MEENIPFELHTEPVQQQTEPKKKYRELVNRKRFSTTLEIGLFDKFRQFSRESGIPQTRLTDEAVELLLKKYGRL